MRPTHKAVVISFYKQGIVEVAIARQTGHFAAGVGHHIRDYGRVQLLLKRNIPVDQTYRLTDYQPGLRFLR